MGAVGEEVFVADAGDFEDDFELDVWTDIAGFHPTLFVVGLTGAVFAEHFAGPAVLTPFG